MAEITDDVETAIDAWARWTRGDEVRGGASSPAWLCMQARKVGIAPRGTAPTPEMPDNVLRIDQSVALLERPLARPFKVYYLQYAPVEEKAARCGLRDQVRTFYRLVERARLIVAENYARRCNILAVQSVRTTCTM